MQCPISYVCIPKLASLCFPQILVEEEQVERASNMDDVEKMATTVLGPDKQQFYPALLHLVVADSMTR